MGSLLINIMTFLELTEGRIQMKHAGIQPTWCCLLIQAKTNSPRVVLDQLEWHLLVLSSTTIKMDKTKWLPSPRENHLTIAMVMQIQCAGTITTRHRCA